MEESLAPRTDVAANPCGALRSAAVAAAPFVLESPGCYARSDRPRSREIASIRRNNLSPDLLAAAAHFRAALQVEPDRNDYRPVCGSLPSAADEIAIQTRSLLQVMLEVAALIDVPPEDITDGRASAGATAGQELAGTLKALQIGTSKSKPADPFVSARYNDNRYYIDDTDLRSKGVFPFLMPVFTLADTSERQELPLITRFLRDDCTGQLDHSLFTIHYKASQHT